MCGTAWPLSAALSFLSRACPDSLPRLYRVTKAGSSWERQVSATRHPPSSRSPGRCLLRRSHIFEAEQLREKGHLCHPFTVATSQETLAPSS
ncbi:hypothetical protein NQZ68_038437 [Dissostichus eleginoides]|nr:hypothetical protein NQZ68_038437 [Dissostichus eleginoides]